VGLPEEKQWFMSISQAIFYLLRFHFQPNFQPSGLKMGVFIPLRTPEVAP
jgi:hypothetical protein